MGQEGESWLLLHFNSDFSAVCYMAIFQGDYADKLGRIRPSLSSEFLEFSLTEPGNR